MTLQDPFVGTFDPFKDIGDVVQSNRLKAHVKVVVSGTDITNKLEPHLISVRVIDEPLAKCEIEIDDRDARLPLPPLGAPVQVSLGWSAEVMNLVFSGTIMDLEYGFGRKQGGRRMWVHATGADFLGSNLKTPMQNSLGEGKPPGQEEGTMHTLPEWLQKVAPTADATVKVSGIFAQIKKDFWAQESESWMQMVQGLGERYGAMVQFTEGNLTKFMGIGEEGEVEAVWGRNLIGLRVRPFNGRSNWAGTNQQYYKEAEAAWDMLSKQFEGAGMGGLKGLAKAPFSLPWPAQGKQDAQNDNQGAENQQGDVTGHGRIVINGEPSAKYNGRCHVKGVRPGVDGAYFIWSAEHHYSRLGYITFMDVTPDANSDTSPFRDGGYYGVPNPANKDNQQSNQSSGTPTVTVGPATVVP